ncbi:MAG: cysteine peptidase family C39 domain-containing protein [Bacteroidota bacterium]
MRHRPPHPPRVIARAARAAVATVAFALLGGCYHGTARAVSAADLEHEAGWVRVTGVPLINQSADRDCGAAALAMVLARWNTPTPPAEIVAAAPVAPDHGIAAGALRDFARGKGLRAFLIKGELSDLAREARANHPVLVGLVQRHGSRATSHYEVIVGINEGARRVLMLDPARGMRQDGFDGFQTEWTPSGNLALVVTGPASAGPASAGSTSAR